MGEGCGALALGVALALSAVAAGPAEAARMIFPGTEWRQESPESHGVDAGKLKAAVDYLASHKGETGVRETFIVRDGAVIWQGTEVDRVHGVWSATKSFTSTVLGLLVDDRKVTLDTRVSEYLPAMAARYPTLTLRHFATMTSGYRAVGDEPQGTYTHGPSTTPFEPGEPLFEPPGSRYAYWDSAMNQFAHALTRIAGEPLDELFRRRVAEPIGMKAGGWRWERFEDVVGEPVSGGAGNHRAMLISARELARLGHLYLNGGRWAGKRILSAAWVRAASSVQVPATLPLGHTQSGIDGRGVYGLNWWVNGRRPDGKRLWPSAPARTFAARGFNNNNCFVVPEWRMVVVRMGLDGSADDTVWDGFFRRLSAALDGGGPSST